MKYVCRLDDITTGAAKEVSVERDSRIAWIVLLHHQGELLGYYNTCPHQGRALNLSGDRFLFDKSGQLVCPHHGACFDVSNGVCTSGPCEGASLKPVSVEVNEGEVFVTLPA